MKEVVKVIAASGLSHVDRVEGENEIVRLPLLGKLEFGYKSRSILGKMLTLTVRQPPERRENCTVRKEMSCSLMTSKLAR
jgi:hypothetical protein